MTIEERLEAFHEENKPFYLVDHDDGSFSLCFPISFLPDEEFERFQAPFDSYATARGIPISAPNGLRNYGNGYDWQAVFQEAFKNDPNIESIKFDCEAGGFFCYCDNLDVIESFGKRFSVLCRNSEQFVPIVAEGLRMGNLW